MISQIAFFQFLGLPTIAWGGILALALAIFTGAVGHFNMKGIKLLNVKWHKILAIVSIIMGLMHGIMGILALKGF